MVDERYILNALLDSYEKSSWYVKGFSKQRVQLLCIGERGDKNIKSSLESLEGEEIFWKALKRLEEKDFITWISEKHQPDVVERIFLKHPEDTGPVYNFLGRTDPKVKAEELSDLLGQFQCSSHELGDALKSYRENLAERKKITHPFSGDIKKDVEILVASDAVASLERDESERLFSSRLFGDSKRFERDLKESVTALLSHAFPSLPKDEVLRCLGLVRYPEVISYSGPMTTDFTDSSLVPGSSYIDSDAVNRLTKAYTTAKTVLTIENKASYYDEVMKRKEDMLVIYTGGYPSPALLRLLRMLYRPGLAFLHWGDIDEGGFRIFRALQDVLPSLTPFRMDCDTLLSNLTRCSSLESKGNDYRKRLEGLLSDERYAVFFPVISLMLEKGIWLEQEALSI